MTTPSKKRLIKAKRKALRSLAEAQEAERSAEMAVYAAQAHLDATAVVNSQLLLLEARAARREAEDHARWIDGV